MQFTIGAACCTLLLLVMVNHSSAYSSSSYIYNGRKVCRGLDRGLTVVGTDASRFTEYRLRYSNCTYIDGNLEITHLTDPSETYNLDFLSQIEEVSGYVLIYQIRTTSIPLVNLRIVRGNNKFTYMTTDGSAHSFSFYVHSNNEVQQLTLDNLAEISSGNLLIEGNSQLCYVDTILWSDITASEWTVRNNRANCTQCDTGCALQSGRRRCWASGVQHCQKYTKVNCAAQCQGSRCYGPNARDCCPQQCAGGCTGPTARNCTACSKFNNNGECVDACPSTKRYDPHTLKNEVDPNGLLAYSTLCVKECPSFMGEEDGACVKQCSEPNKMVSNGKCIPCDGPCPKRCDGVANGEHINANNIKSFEGCNIVDGSIIIIESSFEDLGAEDAANGTSVLQFSDLNALSNVREVTGFVVITSKHIQNLDFLSNLEVIRVQQVNADDDALFIAQTNVTSLQLRRLREIGSGGKVYIDDSPMCYVRTMNWTRIIGPSYKDAIIFGDQLPTEAACAANNLVCDSRCSIEGCWGPGNQNCLSCASYQFNDLCLDSCDEIGQLYDTGNFTCQQCNPECAQSCYGAGPDQCIGDCLHFKLGSTCVAQCPLGMYADSDKLCQPCNPSCKSCTGPGFLMDANGCDSCSSLKLTMLQNVTFCSNASKCPVGFYSIDSSNCWECDASCRDGCYGPTHKDCYACTSFKLFADDSTKFVCIDACPSTHPHELIDPNNKLDTVCSATPAVPLALILGIVIPVVVMIVVSVVVTAVLCRKREVAKAERTRLAAQMSGVDETQPLDPSGQPPDMAQLLLIDESELEIGKPIGNGAFGTVYRGRWKPKNDQNIDSVVVAIKILQDGPVQLQQAELLQEARVMASVNNNYCLRLIGLCLAEKVQLVTALMPLGSLVDYVRKNKGTRQLGSRHFAIWSLQIAKGMAYLEDKGIVHRDLAARNVLLQRPFLAKITDFGLAKLLGEEPIYESKGGKMPIKWLAIESIEQRIFTSRSDVWSYGVTLWEIFTYGLKPYENYRARDIPDLIHRGIRLEQPQICSIDVYTIMLRCWIHDPQERPAFKELEEKFGKISADPPRYFVIDGDRFMRQPSTDPQRSGDEENGWLARLETWDENNECPDDVFEPLISAANAQSSMAPLRIHAANNNTNNANLNYIATDNTYVSGPPGALRDVSVHDYEQPTSPSYSNPRPIDPLLAAQPPPPLPARATRRSHQSNDSNLSIATQQGPAANRTTRNRSESNSSGASQQQSTDLPTSGVPASRERLHSNTSQPINNLNAARISGYAQLPPRKHTSNSSSSNQAANPVLPERALDSRAAQRYASSVNSATSPLVGAEKRASGLYLNPPPIPTPTEKPGEYPAFAGFSAQAEVPRSPFGKAPMSVPYNGAPNTPRTPSQNAPSNVFQFPSVLPTSSYSRIPVDDGEYLQPDKLGKPAGGLFSKPNGKINGDVGMAQNPDYFAMPPVTPVSPNTFVMPQIQPNGVSNGGKRRSDRRPPNLQLAVENGEVPIDHAAGRARTSTPKDAFVGLPSAAVPNYRQVYSPTGFTNGDAWAININGNGSQEMHGGRFALSGAVPLNGNFIVLTPMQDSKV